MKIVVLQKVWYWRNIHNFNELREVCIFSHIFTFFYILHICSDFHVFLEHYIFRRCEIAFAHIRFTDVKRIHIFFPKGTFTEKKTCMVNVTPHLNSPGSCGKCEYFHIFLDFFNFPQFSIVVNRFSQFLLISKFFTPYPPFQIFGPNSRDVIHEFEWKMDK